MTQPPSLSDYRQMLDPLPCPEPETIPVNQSTIHAAADYLEEMYRKENGRWPDQHRAHFEAACLLRGIEMLLQKTEGK